MKNYAGKVVEDLIERYTTAGGSAIQMDEGCCGWGDWILYNDGNNKLSNFIIREVYLNEWSSGHTIRRYRNLPKKYMAIVNAQ